MACLPKRFAIWRHCVDLNAYKSLDIAPASVTIAPDVSDVRLVVNILIASLTVLSSIPLRQDPLMCSRLPGLPWNVVSGLSSSVCFTDCT